jgi:flagellar biosynthesis/type III secretory pathway protein FliH
LNPSDAAQDLVRRAREEAAEILRNAQEKVKVIQEQAYQDGWNAATEEIHNHIDTSKTLVQEVTAWHDELLGKSEDIVLSLVKEISRKIFGEGFVLPAEVLQQTFGHVVENARSLGNLRVYVNPEDAILLGPYWREFQESITSHTIEIIPSNSISRGGCYVNGQWGSADGRVETQLKSILDSLSSDEAKEETSNG